MHITRIFKHMTPGRWVLLAAWVLLTVYGAFSHSGAARIGAVLLVLLALYWNDPTRWGRWHPRG